MLPGRVRLSASPNNAIVKIGAAKMPALQTVTVHEPAVVRPPKKNPVLKLVPDEAVVQKVVKGSIIKPKYKAKYKANGDYSCGDQLAQEIREYVAQTVQGRVIVNLIRLKEIAATNGVWKDSYAKLNAGQQRMTIGNCLRNKMNNGEGVDIGGCVLDPLERDPGK